MPESETPKVASEMVGPETEDVDAAPAKASAPDVVQAQAQPRRGPGLAFLEEAIGHGFADRKLLQRALTHSSFKNERDDVGHDNERLEFLGDAVLELALSDYLFRLEPPRPEGQLTQLRARVVNGGSLSKVAGRLELGRYLKLGRGEEAQGGRHRSSVLANALEGVIGAVFKDSDFETAKALVHRLFADRITEALEGPAKDIKSRLQEWAQSHHRVTPTYKIIDTHGPDHAVSFSAEVTLGTVATATGSGRSKKLAQQAAAQAVVTALNLDI